MLLVASIIIQSFANYEIAHIHAEDSVEIIESIDESQESGDSNDLLLHKFKQIDDYSDGRYFTRFEDK